jgi:hypothetical protein
MKAYSELTEAQKKAAVDRALDTLLKAVCEGSITFDDRANGDKLQARIDKAIDTAHRKQTPWFAGEYVMDAVGEELRGMATVQAEDTLYAEPNDPPVEYGIVG